MGKAEFFQKPKLTAERRLGLRVEQAPVMPRVLYYKVMRRPIDTPSARRHGYGVLIVLGSNHEPLLVFASSTLGYMPTLRCFLPDSLTRELLRERPRAKARSIHPQALALLAVEKLLVERRAAMQARDQQRARRSATRQARLSHRPMVLTAEEVPPPIDDSKSCWKLLRDPTRFTE